MCWDSRRWACSRTADASLDQRTADHPAPEPSLRKLRIGTAVGEDSSCEKAASSDARARHRSCSRAEALPLPITATHQRRTAWPCLIWSRCIDEPLRQGSGPWFPRNQCFRQHARFTWPGPSPPSTPGSGAAGGFNPELHPRLRCRRSTDCRLPQSAVPRTKPAELSWRILPMLSGAASDVLHFFGESSWIFRLGATHCPQQRVEC